MLKQGTGKKNKILQLRINEEIDQEIEKLSVIFNNSKNEVINQMLYSITKNSKLINEIFLRLEKDEKIKYIDLKSELKSFGYDFNKQQNFNYYEIFRVSCSEHNNYDFYLEKSVVLINQNNQEFYYITSGHFLKNDLFNFLIKESLSLLSIIKEDGSLSLS